MRAGSTILLVFLVAWWAFLLTMTHLPKPPSALPHVGDKTLHLVAYAVLGGLLYANLRWRGADGPAAGLLTIAIVMLGGAVDEWTQPLSGRSCELADWCADVAGAALAAVGAAGAWWLGTRRRVS
jgi:VanZ family protein